MITEAKNTDIFGILFVTSEGEYPSFLWFETNEDRNVVFAQLKMCGEVELENGDLIEPLYFFRIDKDTEIYYNYERSVFSG